MYKYLLASSCPSFHIVVKGTVLLVTHTSSPIAVTVVIYTGLGETSRFVATPALVLGEYGVLRTDRHTQTYKYTDIQTVTVTHTYRHTGTQTY